MISVKGVYENGTIKLDEPLSTKKEIPVIVTFLEEIEEEPHQSDNQKIELDDFSFKRSKEILKDFKGSLSDVVIEERRRFI
ncbi:MAG: hypothetical protein GY765_21970 [bacterium]|nr:hypothetical protein [bacterium]